MIKKYYHTDSSVFVSVVITQVNLFVMTRTDGPGHFSFYFALLAKYGLDKKSLKLLLINSVDYILAGRIHELFIAHRV